ncbi:MAG: ATP-binding cassette domain-containing protein [Erysipelotrichaceae bacterium]
MNNPLIVLENIATTYDGTHYVLNGINLEIAEGEFVCFIGKSGCGKTTLLKGINGLVPFTSGTLRIRGNVVLKKDWTTLRRSMGYVIQQGGLFPHLSVEENIAYVLQLNKASAATKAQRVGEMLALVGLDESLRNRKIASLSGGMQQRVGVARALASDPNIILMDEPFGAVDEITRRNLQDELKSLHTKLKKTIVFVTHDIEEAFKLGTRIIMLEQGNIVLDGDKFAMLKAMDESFARTFFGIKNFTGFLSVCKAKEVMQVVDITHEVKVQSEDTLMSVLQVMMEAQVDVVDVMEAQVVVGSLHFTQMLSFMEANQS